MPDRGALGRSRAVRGDFGKGRMATKSKLEQAVEEQIASLNGAQRELVMFQLSVYKRNNARLSQIESELAAVNARRTETREDVRMKQAERSALTYEHGQLSTANSRIAGELFDFLGDR